MKEFNLSDKRYQLKDFGLDGTVWRYDEQDVKEFIKRLKEEIRGFPYINQGMKIDKLAGDKLNGK